ncbi:MAG: hypothetical protein HY074_16725 [Deltaproteobacteria bacterium]|nr:hypothetical protein [Deltaproteobacteria bacterium]
MRGLKLALFSVLLSASAQAGPRADHWSGFDGTVGMPFPSVVGLMVGFNTGDEARVSIGAGSFGDWATYTVDAKAFLSPSSQWSPYFGAGLSYMSGTASTFLVWDLQFDHAFVPYFEGGMDFQSDMGVHVSFNLGGAAPNGRVIVLPGIALGWYF